MQMALSHPISRGGFFVAKVVGAFVAYLAFATTVFGTSLAIVEGARVGGAIAARTGDIARLVRGTAQGAATSEQFTDAVRRIWENREQYARAMREETKADGTDAVLKVIRDAAGR